MLRIKNWSKFQHFKDRRPPWVKLYRELLDDINYHALSDKAGKYLSLIWLVASEMDGALPDSKELAFRLRVTERAISEILSELADRRFLVEFDDVESDKFASTAKEIAARNGFGSRHISDVTKRAVWERDGGKCCSCESTKDIEYDHIQPVSKGGNSEIENIQLLCRTCNRRKRAKNAEQAATHAQALRSLETETETETYKQEIEKKKHTRVPRFDAQAHLISIGVDEQVACDWIAHRKAKRATPTLTAIDGIQQEAAKASITLGKALSISCQRGWIGFEAAWIEKTAGVNGHKSERQVIQDAQTRAIFGDSIRSGEKLIIGEVVQ